MSRERLAYAACAWALAFAASGFYWAAGGTVLLDTIGGEIGRRTRARDPDFVAVGWVTNGLKVIAAVLVLALVRPFGERLPRRPIAGLLVIGGVLLVVYETAELVQHLLKAVGAIDRNGLDDTAVYGHLLLWDPWWILGGVLFALAGWRSRRVRAPAPP
jgi:hypothetical protein